MNYSWATFLSLILGFREFFGFYEVSIPKKKNLAALYFLVFSKFSTYLQNFEIQDGGPFQLVLLLRAKNNQNCSFCDKSMKLPRITNLYKVNIF